jgi:hypothetical protein
MASCHGYRAVFLKDVAILVEKRDKGLEEVVCLGSFDALSLLARDHLKEFLVHSEWQAAILQ